MKTILKCAGLFLFMSVGLQSCEKENVDVDVDVDVNVDVDVTPPQRVEELTAVPQNQAVLLQWTNPSDKDLKHIEIAYAGKSEIVANESGKRIEGLENGKEYTFSVVAVDSAGNKSDAATTTATPEQYVNVLQGTALTAGTYLNIDQYQLQTEIVYSDGNYKQTLTAGSGKYIWEGSLSAVDDTTYRLTCEYYVIDYSGRRHVSDLIEDVNAAFCVTNQDVTYYIHAAYEKISGKEGFLPGTYRRYDELTEDGENGGKEYYYIEVDDSGKMKYSPSAVPEEYTWTNADLLNNAIFFVSFHDRIYLVNMQDNRWYQKQ
ncbi:hypothetical protein AGMMS49965_02050 [Bacteroidia bacterium]|nr:hypothetical protein AGMMS49965_02050 [Bacteroidia bacterium]